MSPRLKQRRLRSNKLDSKQELLKAVFTVSKGSFVAQAKHQHHCRLVRTDVPTVLQDDLPPGLGQTKSAPIVKQDNFRQEAGSPNAAIVRMATLARHVVVTGVIPASAVLQARPQCPLLPTCRRRTRFVFHLQVCSRLFFEGSSTVQVANMLWHKKRQWFACHAKKGGMQQPDLIDIREDSKQSVFAVHAGTIAFGLG